MILTDASPLISLIDSRDSKHDLCRRTARGLTAPFVTTWAAFTEAMHVLGLRAGWQGQAGLWGMHIDGPLELADLSRSATARPAELMGKYADLPMDLADATLVALAEERGEHRIFTLDSDFRVYRLHGRRAFDVVPDEVTN